MKIFTINPDEQIIEEVETDIKANSIYTFFTSILIDEITTLNRHVIYSDANALSNKKRAYFLGEQLLLGDAVIIGRDGMQEIDVSIRKDELNELINYDVPKFYQETLELLSNSDINLYREFICEKDGEKIGLNTEWVLYTFNIADQRTKDYFIENLKQTLDNKDDVEKYIQKMAQLALNASN